MMETPKTITMPEDIVTDLEDKLYDLMNRREQNVNGPDKTVCDLCGNNARDIKGKPQDVKHDAKCLGARLQAFFTRQIDR
jgi:hypothetical protein